MHERKNVAALRRVKIELAEVIRARCLFGRISVAPNPRDWFEWRISVCHSTDSVLPTIDF